MDRVEVDSDDEWPFIARDRMGERRVKVKEGTSIVLAVDEVGDSVGLKLEIKGPEEDVYTAYRFELMLDLTAVYPDRQNEVRAFLSNKAGEFDPSLFDPRAIARIIAEDSSFLLESGGSELNIYLKFWLYEDMVSIDRWEAVDYVDFVRD